PSGCARSHTHMPKLNPKAGPLVAKGVVFPFPVCAVCWFDLLGYGTMIADADFNPRNSRASEALARLRRFHDIVASHSGRLLRTLVMNDGAAAYRDLSMRGSDATLDFLVRCLALFREVKSDEEKHSLPGPRAVLAVGFRMRGRRAGIDETVTQFSSVMRRFKDGKISAEQALREAARIRPTFDVVPVISLL